MTNSFMKLRWPKKPVTPNTQDLLNLFVRRFDAFEAKLEKIMAKMDELSAKVDALQLTADSLVAEGKLAVDGIATANTKIADLTAQLAATAAANNDAAIATLSTRLGDINAELSGTKDSLAAALPQAAPAPAPTTDPAASTGDQAGAQTQEPPAPAAAG